MSTNLKHPLAAAIFISNSAVFSMLVHEGIITAEQFDELSGKSYDVVEALLEGRETPALFDGQATHRLNDDDSYAQLVDHMLTRIIEGTPIEAEIAA